MRKFLWVLCFLELSISSANAAAPAVWWTVPPTSSPNVVPSQLVPRLRLGSEIPASYPAKLHPAKLPAIFRPDGSAIVGGNPNNFDNAFHVIKYDARGNQVWRHQQNSQGGTRHLCAAMAEDAEANVLLLCTENAQTPGVGASQQLRLTKLNANGALVWALSTPVAVHARALQLDSSGASILTGVASGGGLVTVKVSASGVLHWQTSVLGTNNVQPSSVVTDAAGNPYVIADLSNTSGFMGVQPVLVKYDSASGQELWRQSLSEVRSPAVQFSAERVALSPSGHVHVALFVGDGSTFQDIEVVRLDPFGTVQWRKRLKSTDSGNCAPRDLLADASNNLYVGGTCADTLSASSARYLVAKFGAAGTVEWLQEIDASLASVATIEDMVLDSFQNLHAVGTQSSGGLATGLAFKFNSAGVEQWRLNFGDAGYTKTDASRIGISAQQDVIIAGQNRDPTLMEMLLRSYSFAAPAVPGPPAFIATYFALGQMDVHFIPPVFSGGAPFNSFVVTCGDLGSFVASMSPVVVTGMIPGKIYSCVLKAHNVVGPGEPSGPIELATPGVPSLLSATAGNGTATLNFLPPVDDPTYPVRSFVALCSPGLKSATGTGSPIVVTGLSNGMTYSCRVGAQSIGYSFSPEVDVTPSAASTLALVGAYSVKGSYALPVATSGSGRTVEPRAINGQHLVSFQFNGAVGTVGSTVVSGANGQTIIDGALVRVELSSINNASDVTVTLNSVDSIGSVSAFLTFLRGDVDGSRTVDATDLGAVKQRSGQRVNAANFKYDIGGGFGSRIGAADVAAVKSQLDRMAP